MHGENLKVIVDIRNIANEPYTHTDLIAFTFVLTSVSAIG